MEKVADQGDGGHSGPEGRPRPPQQNLSLSRGSEEAVCPVIECICPFFQSPWIK